MLAQPTAKAWNRGAVTHTQSIQARAASQHATQRNVASRTCAIDVSDFLALAAEVTENSCSICAGVRSAPPLMGANDVSDVLGLRAACNIDTSACGCSDI